MPIYEYSCLKCGERVEALQNLNDAPLTTCEACGGTLKKLLSAPAFQFKGTGWYVTDYAKKDKQAEASSSSEGKSSSSSSDSKSDSSTSQSESKEKPSSTSSSSSSEKSSSSS